MIQKLRELWCKWFGHKWDALDLVMFLLENQARRYLRVPVIQCRRCGIKIEAKPGVNTNLYE